MGMEIGEYQRAAIQTDQVPDADGRGLMIPLLGLAGEAGSLLTEYKKRLRDGPAYEVFKERVAEELGDILWYVASIAAKEGLDLEEIAKANVTKVRGRWALVDGGRGAERNERSGRRLYDEAFGGEEQLPRQFRIEVNEVREGEGAKVFLSMDGRQVGNQLTDNAYRDDGYRFHDVFHLGYAAVLGWSPVVRGMMKRKRKSDSRIDEVEDGGRAIVIDEAVSALVFDYARDHSFLSGIETIDYELLRTIKRLTAHLEVSQCSMKEWQGAILQDFQVWRHIHEQGGGVVSGELVSRTVRFLEGG